MVSRASVLYLPLVESREKQVARFDGLNNKFDRINGKLDWLIKTIEELAQIVRNEGYVCTGNSDIVNTTDHLNQKWWKQSTQNREESLIEQVNDDPVKYNADEVSQAIVGRQARAKKASDFEDHQVFDKMTKPNSAPFDKENDMGYIVEGSQVVCEEGDVQYLSASSKSGLVDFLSTQMDLQNVTAHGIFHENTVQLTELVESEHFMEQSLHDTNKDLKDIIRFSRKPKMKRKRKDQTYLVIQVDVSLHNKQISLVTLPIVPLIDVAGGICTYVAGEISEELIGNGRIMQEFAGEVKKVKLYIFILNVYKNGKNAGLAKGMGLGTLHCVLFLSRWSLVWFAGIAVHKNIDNGGESFTIRLNVVISCLINMQAAPDITKFIYPTFEVIERNTVSKTSSKNVRKLGKSDGHIQFKNVMFSYPSFSDVLIFGKLRVNIPSGKIIALVGGSGTRKSTIISLIQRFYEPLSGYILLDIIDIRELDLKWLRQLIDLVNQELALFATTFGDNIFYGSLGVRFRFEKSLGRLGRDRLDIAKLVHVSSRKLYSMVRLDLFYGVFGAICAFISGAQILFFALHVVAIYLEIIIIKGYDVDLNKAYLKANILVGEGVSNNRTVATFYLEEKVLDLYTRELIELSQSLLKHGQVAGLSVVGMVGVLLFANCLYVGLQKSKNVQKTRLLSTVPEHAIGGTSSVKAPNYAGTWDGGFGAVYHAEFRVNIRASKEFLAELEVLTHVDHLNLVCVMGYYVEKSPLFKELKKGYKAFYMINTIDEYNAGQLKEFEVKKPVPAIKESLNLEETVNEKKKNEEQNEKFEGLCKVIKHVIQDKVEKVVVSNRVGNFPCCFMIGGCGWMVNLERIMKVRILRDSIMVGYMSNKKTTEIKCECLGILCDVVLHKYDDWLIKGTVEVIQNIQVIWAINRVVCYHFGPPLEDAVTIFINYCSDASEKDEELHEYSLRTLERFLLRWHRDIHSYCDKILNLILGFLSFTDNMEEDDRSVNEFPYDEDVSWKVEEAAAKCPPRTRPPPEPPPIYRASIFTVIFRPLPQTSLVVKTFLRGEVCNKAARCDVVLAKVPLSLKETQTRFLQLGCMEYNGPQPTGSQL